MNKNMTKRIETCRDKIERLMKMYKDLEKQHNKFQEIFDNDIYAKNKCLGIIRKIETINLHNNNAMDRIRRVVLTECLRFNKFNMYGNHINDNSDIYFSFNINNELDTILISVYYGRYTKKDEIKVSDFYKLRDYVNNIYQEIYGGYK